ncbi:MAG: hypothetical protein P4M15_03815 [Alphaproteobacteria bacterium]|nr:hypothetical protein [Alphaproteobacteria bacterium]
MSTAIVADHLESVLHEIEYARSNIEKCAANPGVLAGEIEQSLVEALEAAHRILEGALSHAQQNGVPRLTIDAA